MNLSRFIISALTTLSLVAHAPVFADAETKETDWLEAITGFKGTLLGAQVISVEKFEAENSTKIHISIPDNKDKKIEEVIVKGKRGLDYGKLSQKNVEVIKDLEVGKTGIVINVGGDTPFKLFINYIDYTESPGQF